MKAMCDVMIVWPDLSLEALMAKARKLWERIRLTGFSKQNEKMHPTRAGHVFAVKTHTEVMPFRVMLSEQRTWLMQ